jgi:hypothetical protein
MLIRAYMKEGYNVNGNNDENSYNEFLYDDP